jgi:hypothetical protein
MDIKRIITSCVNMLPPRWRKKDFEPGTVIQYAVFHPDSKVLAYRNLVRGFEDYHGEYENVYIHTGLSKSHPFDVVKFRGSNAVFRCRNGLFMCYPAKEALR